MYKVYKEAFNMGATQEVPKEAQSLHLISESSDSMEPPDLSFFKISDSDATNNSNSDVISASPGDVTDEDSHDVRNEDPEELQVEDGLKLIWENEQMELKQKLVCEDVCDWARLRITPNNADEHPDIRPLQYLGGVDISFVKDDNINACAALVVIELPTLEVVYEDCTHIELTAPYIPGFLAFREVNFLVDKVKRLQETSPELMPQVILCDGNGILHPREFGVACHLGVLLDIPALGAAKKLYQVFGLEKNEEHKQKIEQLTESDDRFPLVGDSGRILGMALRSNAKTKNPIYVSPGHKLTVDTAVWVVQQCCKYRVPEPIRQADVQSREFLRQNFKPPGVSTAAECSAASCDDSRPSPQPEDVTVCENDSMST